MKPDQAMRLLGRMKQAAPSAIAERLTDVIALIDQLSSGQVHGDVAGTSERQQQMDDDAIPASVLLDRSAGSLMHMLNMIEGQATSLRNGRLGRVTTEQADALKVIVEYAASALSYIDLTQQIVHLNSGNFPLNLMVFNPLDVTAETWQRTFSRAEARGHQFAILADDPLPSVRGDYQHVLSILCALVDNAIQYMPYGGEIKLSVNSLGSALLFNVADSGIGLNAEDHHHVGEPFWRGLHHPLVRQHPGSGLNLYLARRVLEHMDGDLFFSGDPGVGSTFSFTLPAEDGSLTS
ncbi:MAG: ATP-binding protein [Chloroflexi bacterium]|nr:ATP-binding protein [Chloroflexota bacterium]